MVTISNFYHFTDLGDEGARGLAQHLTATAKGTNLRGLFIVAAEGCNATFCGTSLEVAGFEQILRERFGTSIHFKRSQASTAPFSRFVVRIRQEIVTSGRADAHFDPGARHASPDEWHSMVAHEEATVLDTRNAYEVSIGKFRGALDLKIPTFSDFPERVATLDLRKDAPLLIYCTGGVRCEKAYPILRDAGFTNVIQLEGGILNYLESHPEGCYEGECFVFDDRVALDAKLRPTKTYSFCRCGSPAQDSLHCAQCGAAVKLCADCQAQGVRNCSAQCDRSDQGG